MRAFFKTLRIAIVVHLFLVAICGALYPLLVTVYANLFFPAEAVGSQVHRDGRLVGSWLLAQSTTDSRFFHPRPSASGYGTMPSGASNAGPTSALLRKAIDGRAVAVAGGETEEARRAVPVHLLATSASGLDPHLPPEAALFQLDRIATARQWNDQERARAEALIHRLTEPRVMGILGEPRVNVLRLNMELARLGDRFALGEP